MYELINNVPVQIKEYKGQRVVTFKDIDKVHGRPEGTARKRFNDNIKHFIEGEDYFKVCASEIRTHKIMDISPKTHGDIILLTENGYLMLVKSFTDDLAWDVQRQLVNTYFRAKEINNSYDTRIYEKLEMLERKIDMLENDSNIEKIVNMVLDKKFKTFTKASNRKIRTVDSALTEKTEEIINKAVIRTVQTLIPCFDMLNRKIDSVSEFSDKRAENILIRAVKKYAEKFFGY